MPKSKAAIKRKAVPPHGAGRAKKKTPIKKKALVTKKTISQYRKKGYDVGPLGAPDIEKVNAIHEAIKNKTKGGGERTAETKKADERLKNAKAAMAELQLELKLGHFVERDVVTELQVRRELEIKKSLLSLIPKLPAQLAGQNILTIQKILRREFTRILNRLGGEAA